MPPLAFVSRACAREGSVASTLQSRREVKGCRLMHAIDPGTFRQGLQGARSDYSCSLWSHCG